jgi:hypothetical protein
VYDDPAPDGKPYIEAALEFASCPGHPEWDKTYGENATADPEYRQLTVNYADAIYDAAKPEPLPDSDPDPEPMPTGKPRQALVLSIILILACIAVALRDIWLLAHQAQAQGVTMETLQIMPVNEAGEVLLAAIMAILAGGLSSPVTTPVVNVIKLILRRIGKEKAVGGNVIAAIVAMVVTVIIWVSRWAGVELDVNNLLDLLTTIIPPVLTFVGLIAGQKRLYNWAVQKEIPAYGYQRSE